LTPAGAKGGTTAGAGQFGVLAPGNAPGCQLIPASLAIADPAIAVPGDRRDGREPTRRAEAAEVARACQAQKTCGAEHGAAHESFDREAS
jgi:hypothetical protein